MKNPRVRTFLRRARGAVRRAVFRLRDRWLPTLSLSPPAAGELARLVSTVPHIPQDAATREALALMLDHRFDLLGSGWVQVRPGMNCRGFDGVHVTSGATPGVDARNRDLSEAIAGMRSANYRPIDWQIDFRSGYRWQERTWYRDIRYGGTPGADVKVPWELSRLQHLPEFALAYASSADARLVTEFRDQLLDWIAHNPPRFGVNWACTMDVGIRAVNVLLAYDLFRAAGASFDDRFREVLHASMRAHGEHIARNLEWAETRHANHYLGNIAGLLFVAAYLPADALSDTWLLFAIQELEAEFAHQFLPDGGHFEASTSYHRLCAEMLAVCAALLAAVPKPRLEGLLRSESPVFGHGPGLLPATGLRLRSQLAANGRVLSPEFHARLRAAARFTSALSRADGSVPQIGDDDSGRLLRFGAWEDGGSVAECRARFANLAGFDELPGEARYPLQAASTHPQWLAWEAAVNGHRDALLPSCEAVWGAHFALASVLSPQASPPPDAPCEAPTPRTVSQPDVPPVEVSEAREFPGASLLDGLRQSAFPWFGVYVLRSARVHLVIRCGDALRDGAGVHAHDDQLAFELFVDGEAVTRDPGTYVYTADPAARRRYRAASAHAAPVTSGDAREPAAAGVFSAPEVTFGQCLSFADAVFEGAAPVAGGAVIRRVEIAANRITVRDVYRLRAGWKPAGAGAFSSLRSVAYSPGYGIRLADGRR
jgi:hypothetical protein